MIIDPSAPCIAETSKNNTSTDKSFMRKSRYVNPQTVSQIPVSCIASGINILFATVDIVTCCMRVCSENRLCLG